MAQRTYAASQLVRVIQAGGMEAFDQVFAVMQVRQQRIRHDVQW